MARYAAHESSSFDGPQLIISHASLNMPGDFNDDGVIDARDYVVWRNNKGRVVAVGTSADGNRNGLIDDQDYQVWRQKFGAIAAGAARSSRAAAVPEWNAVYLTLVALLANVGLHRQTRSM